MSDEHVKAIYPADVKAIGDGNSGEFEAIVSVFSNVDLTDDVVVPGAYTDSLAEWKASGDPLPVIWSHDWSDPFSHVGVAEDYAELEPGDPRLTAKSADLGGLWVKGQFDRELLDPQHPDGARARQVWRLVKGRRVRNFSFHYLVGKAGFGEKDGRRVRLLEQLRVTEVGPTFLGANPATELVSAKSGTLTAEEVSALRGILAKNTEAPATDQPSADTARGVPRPDPVLRARILLAEHNL